LDKSNNDNTNNSDTQNQNRNKNDDELNDDYDSVLRESALLTTVAAILFGFLLNISVNPPENFTSFGKILLLTTLFSIVIATLLFSLPVIYHHAQYPYKKFDKFQARSHRFIIFGIIPFLLTLYLSLSIAIFIFLEFTYFTPILSHLYSFILSSIPFAIIYILYKKRK
jgi:uncharacterized BrkB/YihY/UPF0761 family membrane protein